jgi:hypothetical protein
MTALVPLLVTLLLMVAPGVALACTCSWTGPFTTVALRADLVVLAEVRAYHRHGMDVAVVDVLRGREDARVIRIWGDTGGLCRPHVTTFPIGTRWVLAVHRSRNTAERGHAISFCGEHWLEARGDEAVGRIGLPQYGDVKESVPLAELLAWIRSGGSTPLAPRPLR